nr:NADH dehydrogenase subunit 2 [Panopea japonica]
MVAMMVVKPSFMIFVGMVLGGIIMAVTSSGVLGVWVGLELNFFGFIPLLLGKNMLEGECCLKYFVIQVLGSGVFFLGVLMVISKMMVSLALSFWGGIFLVCSGLFLKLGLFPFHFWFPSVVSFSSWSNLFLLSTFQKLAPFWVISGLSMGVEFVGFMGMLICVTSLVGAIGGLGQIYFRPLFAYSSLVHSGWMGLLCLSSSMSFLLYMLLYSVILGGFVFSLWLSQLSYVGGLNSKNSSENSVVFWVSAFFLSLAGLPPLLGSALKLYGVLVLNNSFLLVLSVLILSSVVSLFYYLNMFFSLSVSGVEKLDWGMGRSSEVSFFNPRNFFVLLNMVSGILCLLFLGLLT